MSRVALLFPGQGAQYVGMAAELIRGCPAAQQLFERAAEILNYDLASICRQGPAEKLDSTIYSQPALFVASLAALEQLREQSPDTLTQVQAAAGLSLGEYSALVLAGVLDFESALRVVQRRGEAMQAASDQQSSGMVSVLGLDRDVVERLCDEVRQDEILQLANLLCPGNLVVSGHRGACERLAERAEQAGAMKVIPLAVAGAFHTPLMQPAVGPLRDAIANVPMHRPRIPVVSNVDAQPHDDPDVIRRLLVDQVVSPVLWEESLRYLLQQGFDTFYEVGPGRVLRGLLKRIDRKAVCESVSA